MKVNGEDTGRHADFLDRFVTPSQAWGDNDGGDGEAKIFSAKLPRGKGDGYGIVVAYTVDRRHVIVGSSASSESGPAAKDEIKTISGRSVDGLSHQAVLRKIRASNPALLQLARYAPGNEKRSYKVLIKTSLLGKSRKKEPNIRSEVLLPGAVAASKPQFGSIYATSTPSKLDASMGFGYSAMTPGRPYYGETETSMRALTPQTAIDMLRQPAYETYHTSHEPSPQPKTSYGAQFQGPSADIGRSQSVSPLKQLSPDWRTKGSEGSKDPVGGFSFGTPLKAEHSSPTPTLGGDIEAFKNSYGEGLKSHESSPNKSQGDSHLGVSDHRGRSSTPLSASIRSRSRSKSPFSHPLDNPNGPQTSIELEIEAALEEQAKLRRALAVWNEVDRKISDSTSATKTEINSLKRSMESSQGSRSLLPTPTVVEGSEFVEINGNFPLDIDDAELQELEEAAKENQELKETVAILASKTSQIYDVISRINEDVASERDVGVEPTSDSETSQEDTEAGPVPSIVDNASPVFDNPFDNSGAVSVEEDADLQTVTQTEDLLIQCTLHREAKSISFGFGIGSKESGDVVITSIKQGLPADGVLMVNDVIISVVVDDVDLGKLNYDDFVEVVRQNTDLMFVVERTQEHGQGEAKDHSPTTPSYAPSTPTCSPSPTTSTKAGPPVQLITLTRPSFDTSFGFALGMTATSNDRVVTVVASNSPASGKIFPGTKIISVNDTKTADVSYDALIGLLKESLVVDLEIEDTNTDCDNKLSQIESLDFETITVEIERPDQSTSFGLGLGTTTTMTHVVTEVLAGSPSDGKLFPHDVLQFIDGTPTTCVAHNEVLKLIAACDRRMQLVVVRKK